MVKLKVSKGHTSFADGHGTRYWSYKITNIKKKVSHEIIHFDNDLIFNKKYHCYLYWFGRVEELNTDNFKEAILWTSSRLKNYLY